ncbi:Venom serine protease Bi-VSP [Folsomia candida]|uniref:Venom serine protease Bi-VSP n=1 Tax=Folsomia candida TaxID=158441 RepID=A0A226EHW9_FOLCA|nr:Venom serine protease Bi-VSP [Folsomia candida]
MRLSKSVSFWGPVCGIIIFIQHVGCLPVSESETPCELPKGVKGVCKDIAICPAALSNLRSGVRDIVKCSGDDPKLICCPITPRPSAQKCSEYMNILKSSSKGPVPLLPPGFFEDEPEEIHCSLNLNPLISGGRPAEVGEFPHVAVLAYDVPRIPWRCGGTLISDEFLLTAGLTLLSYFRIMRKYHLFSLVCKRVNLQVIV